MALFCIWEDPGCSITLRRGPDPDPTDAAPVLVKAFDAASWQEARQVQYDHYGWGRCEVEDVWEVIGPDEP